MQMSNNLKYFIIITLASLLVSSCLKDDEYIPIEIELNTGAKLLQNMEARGNFINTIEAPGLITPEDIFSNLRNYLVLDIRDSSSFHAGHIPGAKLVSHKDLPKEVKKNAGNYDKIVIVSYTGQSACFYTTLLRYLRYQNVFSLQFGMASWHIDFAQPWIEATSNNFSLGKPVDHIFLNQYRDLPDVDNESHDYDLIVESRIMDLFNETFLDKLTEISDSRFVVKEFNDLDNPAIICYGPFAFFLSNKYGIGHLAGTIHFFDKIKFYFGSQRYLQILPTDRQIIVYSGSGFLSAAAVAYLTILGYDVKSLCFGASRFVYSGISQLPEDEFLYFSNSKIKNFAYQKGF